MTKDGLLRIFLTTSRCSANQEHFDGSPGAEMSDGMVRCNKSATRKDAAARAKWTTR
eukprot:CAMPEP_0175469798 /NCGR_PEP_ID=MMETSP0095-20121207/72524_1 /TAXON_ID=311494 /ORGANISM="Alexandrium monilatum, Strain CCMP3105" /LENGTH=56 /DNA_ID=CAMNT_0016771219 /DNA_START=12 /DNA_END=179 /DNA_ORIENTATION=+